MRFKEIRLPDDLKRQHMALAGFQHGGSLRLFVSEGRKVRAFLSRSQCGLLPDGKPDLRWHISVSAEGQSRLPTWEEMKEVRLALKPEVFFVIQMPPEKYWMNYGEVLHLAETKDENMIEQAKYEGERAREDEKIGLGYGSTMEDVLRKRGVR